MGWGFFRYCFFCAHCGCVCVCVCFKKTKTKKGRTINNRWNIVLIPVTKHRILRMIFRFCCYCLSQRKKKLEKSKQNSALLSQEKMDVNFFGVVAMGKGVQKSQPYNKIQTGTKGPSVAWTPFEARPGIREQWGSHFLGGKNHFAALGVCFFFT